MNSSTKPFRAPAIRRTHLNVPLNEMRRLMRVYGSTKCPRKRQSPRGEGAKEESVKRKFYRWFPDLEARFAKDAAGFWRPRFGHEFEMKYRDEMRKKDGEVTSRKRTTSKRRTESRRMRLGVGAKAPVVTEVSSGVERAAAPCVTSTSGGGDQDFKQAGAFSVLDRGAASASMGCDPFVGGKRAEASSTPAHETASTPMGFDPVTPPPPCPGLPPRSNPEVLPLEDAIAASLLADIEPLDGSFRVELGIFDDVERNFYGADPGPGPSPSYVDASAAEGPRPGASEDVSPPSAGFHGPCLGPGTASSSVNHATSEAVPRPPASSEEVALSFADGVMLECDFMAEYCAEVLASGDEGGASAFRLGAL